jgi:hypothetical protein
VAGYWGKPVVIDECGYEGDLENGWGKISGEEMLRRFWEGAIRGGYVGHDETYWDPITTSGGPKVADSSAPATGESAS